MTMTAVQEELCAGVFAVPPFARRRDRARTPDFDQNDHIVNHIVAGGITRLLYGGNAFLYHFALGEFEQLLDWLSSLATGERLGHGEAAKQGRNDTPVVKAIPSLGPDYGVAIEQ